MERRAAKQASPNELMEDRKAKKESVEGIQEQQNRDEFMQDIKDPQFVEGIGEQENQDEFLQAREDWRLDGEKMRFSDFFFFFFSDPIPGATDTLDNGRVVNRNGNADMKKTLS